MISLTGAWALSRRCTAAGALGLALTCAGFERAAAGPFDNLFGSKASLPASEAVEPLATSPEYRSENGVLEVALEARETQVKLGRWQIQGATYNGSYAGPVLRLKPGDTLHLRLTNRLPQATNIHFHGLAVSPQGHGDNSMHMVAPGETWDYEIAIPKDHAPGVYWFHTHAHSFAERQLMGGLSGTLVIDGFQDQVPATKPLRERLMALKEFAPTADGKLQNVPKPYNFEIRSLNGQVMPKIDIQPGETQLWRLSDQTANTYYRLSLEGHSFTVVGRDSHPVAHPEVVKEVMLGPAERADVLVTGGPAGSYTLVSEDVNTGPAGDTWAAQNMALLVSARDANRPAPAALGALTSAAAGKPVPGDKIDAQRLVVFSEDSVTGLFFINHQTFDHERIDMKLPLGSVEEWTIRNASDELHVFHIHQVDFQVLSVNGRDLPFDGRVDTVNIPVHGEVKIRIAFTDPTIIGRFMFHCHILEHEDKGMMAQIEVYDPKIGPMPEGHDTGAMPMGGMAMTHDAPSASTEHAVHVSQN